ncbi:MAG: 30S ribosomal protein S17e [Candidatus Woesearchaeota archaeon]
MGRVKTTQVKRATKRLAKEHGDQFKKDFSSNKKIVDKLLDVKSKKLRNVIAGYITRLTRKSAEEAQKAKI